jgi:hypothetical protein
MVHQALKSIDDIGHMVVKVFHTHAIDYDEEAFGDDVQCIVETLEQMRRALSDAVEDSERVVPDAFRKT